jgi:hypothetical protein
MNGYEIRRFKTANGNFFVYEVDTLTGSDNPFIIGEGYYVDPEGKPLGTKSRARRDDAMYERNIAEMTQGINFKEETIKGPLAEKLSELFDRRIPKQKVFGKPKEVHSPFAVEKLKALREKMGK